MIMPNRNFRILLKMKMITVSVHQVCISSELTNYVAPEPEISLPHSQELATGSYPEPRECTKRLWANLSIVIPPSHLRLCLPSGPFPSKFPPKPWTIFSPLSCVPHAPPTSFSLGLICLMISGDKLKLRSSTVCNFLHSPVTLSVLGPDILVSTLFCISSYTF
jgi:hypothetical protein